MANVELKWPIPFLQEGEDESEPWWEVLSHGVWHARHNGYTVRIEHNDSGMYFYTIIEDGDIAYQGTAYSGPDALLKAYEIMDRMEPDEPNEC